ncbi:hypothetical protein JL720_17216 [Aureococcus anophagefferens]|nr:hypothetical protein JL720_17216 [Aureococcus anophagefferens]
MWDSFGDGICCASGSGSWKLKLDGAVIHEGSGDYDKGASHSFRRRSKSPAKRRRWPAQADAAADAHAAAHARADALRVLHPAARPCQTTLLLRWRMRRYRPDAGACARLADDEPRRLAAAFEPVAANLHHEKVGPVVSVPKWTRLEAAKNGQCAAVAVAYEPKFRTAYHHAGQAAPKPTPGPGGVLATGPACPPSRSTLREGASSAPSRGVLKTGRATVYEFKRSQDAWVTKGEPLDGGDGDGAGSAVDVSDSGAVVVVARRGVVGAGSVRVRLGLRRLGGAHEERGPPRGDAAGDAFGRSVSLSGSGLTVAIGATQPPVFVEAGCGAGYVKVFAWKNGNKWVQKKTTLAGGEAGDCLGGCARAAVRRFAVGARARASGHAPGLDLSQSGWHAAGSELIGENKGDIFGAYPSLSDDGKTLSVAPASRQGAGAVSV